MRNGVFAIAAAFAHAFVYCNKRTAFAATFLFLGLYSVFLRPDPVNDLWMMEDLAVDQVNEDAFAAWLRDLAPETDAV